MQITILAFGTRGDVQPLLALSRGLIAAGHHVRMLASANFSRWIESYGVESSPTQIDIQALMQSPAGHEWIANGTHPTKQLATMRRMLAETAWPMMRDAWAASQGADALISSFTSDVFATAIAAKLGVPHISTPLQPTMRATRSGAASTVAVRAGDSWLNYLVGKALIEPLPWRLLGDHTNRLRREVLGLPPQTRRENRAALDRMLVLQGYSPAVVPQPADWPATIQTTGYWFLDAEAADWQPPAALETFLAAGAPPVYIGFGSMTGHDPQAMTKLLLKAAALSGRRIVLQTGWANLGGVDLPENVLLLESAPHAWLFPRMAAVVHHGGAGTTGASLRAGLPTVIVPHMADQLFWGARVSQLGAGPRPIPRPKLTAAKLAGAIDQALRDQAMRQRAAALGAAISAEDGVARAVAAITAHLHA